MQVLEKLNLTIEPGKTVALVGPSGCGKSTCMQLILRYYDPESGVVELDDMASVDYPLGRIRAKMGLVSQEPTLFDRTIAENIAYGDNERVVPMADIIEAAKSANIHDFVSKLPNGYDTGLGSKGEMRFNHSEIIFKPNFLRRKSIWRSETTNRNCACFSQVSFQIFKLKHFQHNFHSVETQKSCCSTKPLPHSTIKAKVLSKPQSTRREKDEHA